MKETLEPYPAVNGLLILLLIYSWYIIFSSTNDIMYISKDCVMCSVVV